MESIRVLLFVTICIAAVHAQAPIPAPTVPTTPAPAPAGSMNLTGILDKAGGFSMFISLLKGTQTMNQLQIQLGSNNQGMTIFAPSDAAFQALKPGTLNGITDQEKMALLQYHVLPQYYSMGQFQTASNPVRTMASGNGGPFGVNVTAFGNSVNISTGVVSTPIDNAVYSKNPVAVYQVDKVLLPEELFGAKPPAEAPAPEAGAPTDSPTDSPSSSKDDSASTSHGGIKVGLSSAVSLVVGLVVGMSSPFVLGVL